MEKISMVDLFSKKGSIEIIGIVAWQDYCSLRSCDLRVVQFPVKQQPSLP